jgi:hypothetical protein
MPVASRLVDDNSMALRRHKAVAQMRKGETNSLLDRFREHHMQRTEKPCGD